MEHSDANDISLSENFLPIDYCKSFSVNDALAHVIEITTPMKRRRQPVKMKAIIRWISLTIICIASLATITAIVYIKNPITSNNCNLIPESLQLMDNNTGISITVNALGVIDKQNKTSKDLASGDLIQRFHDTVNGLDSSCTESVSTIVSTKEILNKARDMDPNLKEKIEAKEQIVLNPTHFSIKKCGIFRIQKKGIRIIRTVSVNINKTCFLNFILEEDDTCACDYKTRDDKVHYDDIKIVNVTETCVKS